MGGSEKVLDLTGQIKQVESQVHVLDMQIEAAQAVQALQDALPTVAEVLKKTQSDLGAELKVEDFVQLHQTSEGLVLGPGKLSATTLQEAGGKIISGGRMTGETLEALGESLTTTLQPFADHQNALLGHLGTLKGKLDEGSELLGMINEAYENVGKAKEVLKDLMAGEIADDKLMERFADYLELMGDAVGAVAGNIPVLGEVFKQFMATYTRAVREMATTVERLRQHKVVQERVVKVFKDTIENANDPQVTDLRYYAPPGSPSARDIDPLREIIDVLRHERSELVTKLDELREQQLEGLDESSRREIEALDREAQRRAGVSGTLLRDEQVGPVVYAIGDLERRIAIGQADGKDMSGLEDEVKLLRAKLDERKLLPKVKDAMVEILIERPHLYGDHDRAALIQRGGIHAEAVKEAGDRKPAGGLWQGRDVPIGMLVGIIALVMMGIGAMFFLGGDDEPLVAVGDEVPTAEESTGEDLGEGDGTGASDESSDADEPVMTQVDPDAAMVRPGMSAAMEVLSRVTGTSLAAMAALTDAVPAGNTTTHSNGVLEAVARQHADITDVLLDLFEIDDEAAEAVWGSGAERGCGTATTMCADPANLPSGEVTVVVMGVADAPPADPATDEQFQFGFVFDVDGDAGNNYAASPDFPQDFFDGTDRWYQVVHGSGHGAPEGWALRVDDLADRGSTSNAVSMIIDDVVLLVVETAEVPPGASRRLTAFSHGGDFGLDPPHVWSGDVLPPVGQPLAG